MLIYEKEKVNNDLTNKAYEFIIGKFKKTPFVSQLNYDCIDAALLTTIGKKDYKPNAAIFIAEKGIYIYRYLTFGSANGFFRRICFDELDDIYVKQAFVSKLILKTKSNELIKVETAAYVPENFDLIRIFKRKIDTQIEKYKEDEAKRLEDDNQPVEMKQSKTAIEDEIVLPDINLDINTKLDNGNNIKITDYKESLKTGGTLIVEPKSWRIEYYFPGPDLRYNGKWYSIYASDIDKYIKALEINFAKYIELKEKLKTEHITCEGDLGMAININQRHEGVCLFPYHMNIMTQKQLDKLIYDFKYAKARAKQVRELLRKKED